MEVAASRSQIILANTAQSKNIFWAVGISTTLRTTSVSKGTTAAYASDSPHSALREQTTSS